MMKTMVCTGCSGNWACTVELGVDDLEPDRCICYADNDPHAEWLDTTGKTKVRLEIAKAAVEFIDDMDNSTLGKLCDLCKKLAATP